MAATFKKAEGLSRHNSWRRVQSPGIACSGTRGPAAPSSQCGAVIPACFPVPLPSSERGESRTGKGVKAGQGRADALPAPSLAAALVPPRGSSGLALPGLCWRRSRWRTLAIPREICQTSKFLPCSTHVIITPSTARATAWKMSVVLERGAAGGAENSLLGHLGCCTHRGRSGQDPGGC